MHGVLSASSLHGGKKDLYLSTSSLHGGKKGLYLSAILWESKQAGSLSVKSALIIPSKARSGSNNTCKCIVQDGSCLV